MKSASTGSWRVQGLPRFLAVWLAMNVIASYPASAQVELNTGAQMTHTASQLAPGGALSGQQMRDRERSRVEAERQLAERIFEREQAVCRTRFFETDCVNDARAKRRAVMDDLRRQEVSLNDAERRENAARSDQRIREREAERQSPARVEQETRAKEQDARRLERVQQRAAEREARRPEVSQRVAKQTSTVTKKVGEGQKATEDRSARAAQVLADRASNEQKFAQRKADALARQGSSSKAPGAPLPVPPMPSTPVPAPLPIASTPDPSAPK